MRVLIAEDSAIERMVLQSVIEDLHHTCLIAANGAEAWELFYTHGADVVISDWEMPHLDGLELCRRVRAHPDAPYTYFIFLTMLEDKPHARLGMEAGADDYLTKPLDVDDLQLRLIAAERVTAVHRQLAEAQRAEGRLEGVMLATRTLEHELGNKLALTVGYAELLAASSDLPPALQQAAREALRGATEAFRLVEQLQQIKRIEETDWGPRVGPTIDIARSTAPCPES
jgi:DNA-binding response OmpR family regulator